MPKKERDYIDDTLDFYHKVLGDLRRITSDPKHGLSGSKKPVDLKKRAEATREVWAYLNEARVFAFEPEIYVHLYQEADYYTTEVMAGLPYVPAGQKPPPDEEAQKLFATVMKECKHVHFPNNWPFETVFVGFGMGVHVSAADFQVRAHHYGNTLGINIDYAYVRGYLITTKNGYNVWELTEFGTSDGNSFVVPEQFLIHGNWQRSYSLVPWITQGTHHLLSSYRKFIEETTYTATQKYERSKEAKKVRSVFMPRPYYVVKLTSSVIEEQQRKPGHQQSYRYSYRFDVRGHERIRVRRGRLPLDPKSEAKLRKSGYQIFVNQITDEFIAKLFQRHITPKSPDEWIAVKSSWIDSYQKGPDDAPYVPAVRTPTKGKAE